MVMMNPKLLVFNAPKYFLSMKKIEKLNVKNEQINWVDDYNKNSCLVFAIRFISIYNILWKSSFKSLIVGFLILKACLKS